MCPSYEYPSNLGLNFRSGYIQGIYPGFPRRSCGEGGGWRRQFQRGGVHQSIILAISSQNCMKSNEIGPGARPQLPLGFLKLSLGGYLKPRYVTALVSRIFRNLCISWKMRTWIFNRHIIHNLQVTGFMPTFSKEPKTGHPTLSSTRNPGIHT